MTQRDRWIASGAWHVNVIERNALVIENLPLVGYLVSEVWARATHLSRDDLASAGAVALITSADAYNPALGIPFGAFARKRIVGAFADEMRSSDWATRGARRRIKETMAVKETLTSALGRTPSVDEIASAMGVERQEAEAALADAARVVAPLDDNIADLLIADTALPEETLLAGERLGYLKAAIESLPEKMRTIITQIYFEDRAVKDIAQELGITHSAVSQQRAEAVRLLRDGLETYYSDSEAEHSPVSRVSSAARSAYLGRMATAALVSMSAAAQQRTMDAAAS